MSSPHTSRQLDIFRGFAAILMVLNHAGFHWLAPIDATTGFDGIAVFLGSAAPALFFFATGVGMGLSRRGAVDWPGIVRKVVLLQIADLFLGWSVHRWIGLDFFAFCAISMLAVALVTATRRPVLTAALAIAACLFVRYAVVSRLGPLAGDYRIVAFVTGIDGVVDVSYPLSPWLVFPLAGFILARHTGRQDGTALFAAPRICVAIVSAATGAAAWWLDSRGAAMHRWNTVSVAYFLFAIAFVGLVWLLADALAPASGFRVVSALQTRGPASLLIVPVHYALIGIAAAVLAPPWSAAAWLPAALALCAVALASSKWIANCLRHWVESARVARGLALSLPACAAVIAICVLAAPPLACLLVACAGQVLVAANLARPDAVTRRGIGRAL